MWHPCAASSTTPILALHSAQHPQRPPLALHSAQHPQRPLLALHSAQHPQRPLLAHWHCIVRSILDDQPADQPDQSDQPDPKTRTATTATTNPTNPANPTNPTNPTRRRERRGRRRPTRRTLVQAHLLLLALPHACTGPSAAFAVTPLRYSCRSTPRTPTAARSRSKLAKTAPGDPACFRKQIPSVSTPSTPTPATTAATHTPELSHCYSHKRPHQTPQYAKTAPRGSACFRKQIPNMA
jgi:hypothetical protein